MDKQRIIDVVGCHAAGEIGDVIVGGVLPPPGKSIWEQSRFIAKDQNLRNFMLNEPRGGMFKHVNLLVPGINPKAQMGYIIMEPEDTPPMSGSNTICVATVLLETGIIKMVEPVTYLTLEAPAGLIEITAKCRNGKVLQVSLNNVASFVAQSNAVLEVEGIGTLRVDIAYGGDSFVIVDAEDLGFNLLPDEARELAKVGVLITNAANEQLGFSHPDNADWKHVSFCQIAGAIRRNQDGILTGKNAVAIKPGKIDRSPTGTGVSARMALLHSQGKMKVGERYIATSILNSSFEGQIVDAVKVGALQGIVPKISGQAWLTGDYHYKLDPTDPWPEGYRLSDTWPKL